MSEGDMTTVWQSENAWWFCVYLPEAMDFENHEFK